MPPTPPPPDAPYWFQRHPALTLASVTLVGLVLAVALLEAAYATFQPLPPFRPDHFGDRSIRLREFRPSTSETRQARATIIRLSDGLSDRAVRFETDADGFILPARVHAAPDLTVVFHGGSTTACELVADSLRFPALVGPALGARLGLDVNTFNAGVSGNHAMHSLDAFVAKGLPLEPDVAVLMHAVNDLTLFVREGEYWTDNASRSLVVPAPCDRPGCGLSAGVDRVGLRVLPNLWRRIRLVFDPQTAEFSRPGTLPDSAASVAAFRSALTSFVVTARAWGVQPVLMTQANRLEPTLDPVLRDGFERRNVGIPYADYQRLYVALNDATRATAAALDAPLVDLAAAIPPEPRYLYDYVHLTDEGSTLAAGLITDAIADLTATTPEAP